MIGTALNHYRIIAELGAGGMGEVYRARDTKLGREVAIKLLTADYAESADQLRRFEQEARTLAALNHPNILVVHDTGVHEGVPYFVSELLEGQTLREVLSGVPFPARKAIEYALQIAQGLSAAHSKGVIHRDLKPENLFVTQNGRVKILDFGLAKLKRGAGVSAYRGIGENADSPTPRHSDTPIHSDVPTLLESTHPGVVLGTPSYMSPEQVRGEAADHRSDIFAFGAILYEMLSGQRAFRRDTHVETMNAILKEEPPELAEQLPNLPPALERIVRRCLEKRPEQRFQSASDLAFALENTSGTSSSSMRALGEATVQSDRLRRRLVLGSAAAVLLTVIAFLMVNHLGTPGGIQRAVRLSVVPPFDQSVIHFEISPDGRSLAICTGGPTNASLSIRPLDSLVARPILNSAAMRFFWSPDSRFIGFFADGKLKTVSVESGRPKTVCDARGGGGGTWNQDGVIVFSEYWNTGLFSVSAEGGEPTALTALNQVEEEDYHLWPSFLPDGNHFLYLVGSIRRQKSTIWLGSLDSNDRRAITPADALVGFAPPGFLLFTREGTLYAQPFSARRCSVEGPAFAVTGQVAYGRSDSKSLVSVSANGVLAYRSERSDSRQWAWLDRAGRPLGTVGPAAPYWSMRLSPDGRSVAAQKFDGRTGTSDIWHMDATSGLGYPLTTNRNGQIPVWSPDGREVVFTSDQLAVFDLYRRPLDRSKPEQLLFRSNRDKMVSDWSRDGRFILFQEGDSATQVDVWLLALDQPEPQPLIQTRASEAEGRFSPDVRWVAFTSNESGRNQIYVQSFPDGATRIPISQDGGSNPKWHPSGKELFFLSPENALMSVELKIGASELQASPPKPLFVLPTLGPAPVIGGYDVSADGLRFLMNLQVPGSTAQHITVVLNWTADLKR